MTRMRRGRAKEGASEGVAHKVAPVSACQRLGVRLTIDEREESIELV